ncbi:MAG: response regulator transcription factor [Verrucomicrobiia bacterium]|jgi:DNA-binding NarL/FixJ family response regulator
MKKLKTTVSVIDDDSAILKILAEWISESSEFQWLSGHTTAQSALARLPGEKPNIVLADINLGGQSGVHCVEVLKPQMPDTEFVMLTVYEDVDHIFKALAAGATGYLLKRTAREELFASLKQVREGGSPMTSYIARKVVKAFQSAPKQDQGPEGLSPREAELLGLLARGFAYKEICETMQISLSTVNTHVHRIYQKLHVRSRGEAVAVYAKIPRGPLSPNSAFLK